MELSIEDGGIHPCAFHTCRRDEVTDNDSDVPIRTLSFDHISPRLADPASISAKLYFDPSSPTSAGLLTYLEKHSTSYPSFRYIVRYKPSQTAESRYEGRKTALSGYGVELALKRTDYLVVDDRATGGSTGGNTQGTLEATRGRQDVGGLFGGVLGKDPWSELSTPLRPTELASKP